MYIFVTLNNIDTQLLSPDEIITLIGDSVKNIYDVNPAEQIQISLSESNKSDSIENNIKVLLQIFSDRILNNSGSFVVNLKSRVLEIFSNKGVPLERKEVVLKLFSESKYEKLLRDTMKTQPAPKRNVNDEFNYEEKSKQYIAVEPSYSFERVILPQETIDKIQEAIGILECENKVFKEWGLYEIQPHPSTALSFFGPSGTGKTMAAEAVAHKLGRKILKVSYADVESKYHGEGPKMVKAIFLAASNSNAVLFFDEADSLLSKRLTNVTQGSEQAINSMRSQLLICLEEFRGIVIFATNLVVNYDQAFLTRLISVEFKLPDVVTREKIWDVHIKAPNDGKKHQLKIPLSEDVDIKLLASTYDFVGREIRNAVVSACVSVALSKRDIVTQEDFKIACDKIVVEKKALADAKDYTKSLQNSKEDLLKKAILNKINSDRGHGENVSEQA